MQRAHRAVQARTYSNGTAGEPVSPQKPTRLLPGFFGVGCYFSWNLSCKLLAGFRIFEEVDWSDAWLAPRL